MTKVGDVIQITDTTHHWYPCLLIVDEVKSWGVQACLLFPADNTGKQPTRAAWIRLEEGTYKIVGRSVIKPA